MVFILSFNIAVSRVILQPWQWQSVGYGPVKMLRSSSARPTWLDCKRSAVLLPHFRSVLTTKDLKFRFHTSALPWLPKTWCSTSALPLCLDCQRSEVPLPLCPYCQRSEVPHPHFHSALSAKNVKFRFRTSALPWLPKMWSFASALPLCLDWQRSEVLLSALVLPGLLKMWSSASVFHLCQDFQRFAVSLLHFRWILTAKDLKIIFSTYTLSSLPNTGSSASALPFCLDCKRSVVSHFRSAFDPKDVNALLLCLNCQSSASSVPLEVHIMYFHTISCCLTWRISPSERRGILIRKQKSKPSNSHLVKFKRCLHVSECNLASTWKNCWTVYIATLTFRANGYR